MENSSDTFNLIIGLIIFLIIVVIVLYLYRKMVCPIPKRKSFIVKNYFLRERYEHKRLIRITGESIVSGIKEYLLALNYIPVNEYEDLWYLKNADNEYFLSLVYKDKSIEILLFAKSIFNLTKMSLILEQILGNEEFL
ncbi:MAG: hypothetical protein ACTSRG_17785 [Candidatus Helarchaeota archaeon]